MPVLFLVTFVAVFIRYAIFEEGWSYVASITHYIFDTGLVWDMLKHDNLDPQEAEGTDKTADHDRCNAKTCLINTWITTECYRR